MQLVRLKIVKDSEVLRDIQFKEGVNFITNSGEGNQIGKSTTLRAINFCLGSDGKDLWKDPDRKIENLQVKRFVLYQNVVFSLELSLKGTRYLVERRFIPIQQKNREVIKIHSQVNGKEFVGKDQYAAEIARIFGHFNAKPTFKSIKNRFVRLEKATINRLFRYLNLFTSDDEYLELYSHLFGYAGHESLSQEIRLKREIKETKDRITALLNGKKEDSLVEDLQSLDDELAELLSKEEDFDFKGAQTAAIRRLKDHRYRIAELSSHVAQLETRALYSNKTLANYKAKIADVDVSQVSAI